MKKRLTRKINIFIETLVGAVRNSELENLHAGRFPMSKTGDYTDVKVVTPYGEIPWNELSRISDKEMGPLKDSFRYELRYLIRHLINNGLEFKIEKNSPYSKFLEKIK